MKAVNAHERSLAGLARSLIVTGQSEPRKAPSGKNLVPAKMVSLVCEMARDWRYDAIAIGFPGITGHRGPISEPANLGERNTLASDHHDMQVRHILEAEIQGRG